jgi:uncharacterized protein (UPF0276 family)
MIERDDHIPPLGELCAELELARSTARRALAEAGTAAPAARATQAVRAGAP